MTTSTLSRFRPGRRQMLGTSIAAAAALALVPLRAAAKFAKGLVRRSDTAQDYEIVRTEEEWRALLSDHEYKVLRDGITELQETSRASPAYQASGDGVYACRGCDLSLFPAGSRVDVEGNGYVFFKTAFHDSLLVGQDGPQPNYGQDPSALITLIEVHCRRCASHTGHILLVQKNGDVLYCNDGSALAFHPQEAA